MTGNYYQASVEIEFILIYDVASRTGRVSIAGPVNTPASYNATSQLVTINASIPLTMDISVSMAVTDVYTGTAAVIVSLARALWLGVFASGFCWVIWWPA